MSTLTTGQWHTLQLLVFSSAVCQWSQHLWDCKERYHLGMEVGLRFLLSSQSGAASMEEVGMSQALSPVTLALIYENKCSTFLCFKDLYVLRAVVMNCKLKQ